MPYPLPYIHGIGVGRVGIRINFLIQMPTVSIVMHNFPITIFFNFFFVFYALLLSDNKSRVL